jgi:hypothetical protein
MGGAKKFHCDALQRATAEGGESRTAEQASRRLVVAIYF